MTENSDPTIDLLAQEVYAGSVGACGPDFYYQQIVKSKAKASTFINGLCNLVPDNVYTPRVTVAVDFSYTYVQKMEFQDEAGATTKLDGQRIVSPEVVMNAAKSLLYYYNYYYDYIVTYCGKSLTDSSESDVATWEHTTADESMLSDETDSVLFINKILNFFLTSINVTRVRNDISTCTLSFRDAPQYDIAGKETRLFFKAGLPLLAQLFSPMLPFTVWARGRIYSDFMFPLYTGYITRITHTNDQGFTTFKIDGRDALELARISFENINPSLVQSGQANQSDLNFFSKSFYGLDHMDIVRSMFLGGAAIWDEKSNRIMSIEALTSNTVVDGPKIYPIGTFLAADEEPGNLTPAEVVDNRSVHVDSFSPLLMLGRLRFDKFICAWGYNLTPFRPFGNASRDVFTSNFSNRLDILKNVAANVYYDFYVDGAGHVHYHPMRLANDFLFYDSFYPSSVPVPGGTSGTKLNLHAHNFPFSQVVSSEELTSLSATKNIEELKTYCRFEGAPSVEGMEPTLADIVGSARDDINLVRFGYRYEGKNIPMVNENFSVKDKNSSQPKKILDIIAKVFLDFANGELYSMTASMLFRPELEISLPIYLVDNKEIFYIQSITHTIEIGSNASTVINASFGRWEEEPEVDMLSYMLHTELLDKAQMKQIRYVGSAEALTKSIDFVIPLTLHAEDRAKRYKDLDERKNSLLFP